MKYVRIFVIIAIIAILSLTIGYSILYKEINIESKVLVGSIKDIRISELVDSQFTNNGYEINDFKYTKSTFNVSIGLLELTSKVSYKIKIKNYSDTIMQVKSITSSIYTNSSISYSIINLDQNTIFNAGEEKSFDITFYYEIDTLPDDTNLNSLFEIEFKEYVRENNYVIDGLILDLRGTDQPINNIWYDRVNNKPLLLTPTVTYNVKEKYYDFSTDLAYGKINESVIPLSGDFTLESAVKLPNSLTGDNAIISQVSDTESDTGRIKFNLKDEELVTFFNRQFPNNTNLFYKFTSAIAANRMYLLQLVRNGEKLKLYLNGNLISTNDYLSTNVISSGPFKVARFNDSNIQQYRGGVYSIRVYNRAISAEELTSNASSDIDEYKIRSEYATLKEYAISSPTSSLNDGLYYDNLNRYVYRGTSVNNYLKINGSDSIYRIIFFNNDDTMKIIDTSTKVNIPFDESGSRNLTSTYCDYSESIAETDTGILYGCNAWMDDTNYSNGNKTGTVLKDATINTYLNTTYYNSLPSVVKDKIKSHDFNIGTGIVGISRDEQNIQSTTTKWNGKVGTITLSDSINASITSVNITSTQTKVDNYIVLLSGAKDIIWTMTNTNVNTYDVYAISLSNLVGKKRGSRYSQPSGSTLYTTYAMPAFYISSDVAYSGDGTIDDPFIIN